MFNTDYLSINSCLRRIKSLRSFLQSVLNKEIPTQILVLDFLLNQALKSETRVVNMDISVDKGIAKKAEIKKLVYNVNQYGNENLPEIKLMNESLLIKFNVDIYEKGSIPCTKLNLSIYLWNSLCKCRKSSTFSRPRRSHHSTRFQQI